MNKSEISTIQLRVLNERIKELNQELHEFAILEVEATTQREKIKWGLRVAETKELLSINTTGIEVIQEVAKLETKLANVQDFEELMSIFEDINSILDNLK